MAKNPNRFSSVLGNDDLTRHHRITMLLLGVPALVGSVVIPVNNWFKDDQQQVNSFRARPSEQEFKLATLKYKLAAPSLAQRTGILGVAIMNVCRGSKTHQNRLENATTGEEYTDNYMEALECSGYNKRIFIVSDSDSNHDLSLEKDVLYIINSRSSDITPLDAQCNPKFAFHDITNCAG